MNEKHPNRKKDKHNPYTLMIVEGRYYLSFKDGRGVMQNIEIRSLSHPSQAEYTLKQNCRHTL